MSRYYQLYFPTCSRKISGWREVKKWSDGSFKTSQSVTLQRYVNEYTSEKLLCYLLKCKYLVSSALSGKFSLWSSSCPPVLSCLHWTEKPEWLKSCHLPVRHTVGFFWPHWLCNPTATVINLSKGRRQKADEGSNKSDNRQKKNKCVLWKYSEERSAVFPLCTEHLSGLRNLHSDQK